MSPVNAMPALLYLVDGAVVLVDRVGVHLKCLALGDVQPVGLHRRADGLQPLLGHREALGVDVTDRQLGAGAPELDRKGLADSVTTATLPAKPSMSEPPRVD